VKEVSLPAGERLAEAVTFAACLATILELPLEDVPVPGAGQRPARSMAVGRWLGGLGLGLVPVADPASFAWAGPWLARARRGDSGEPRWLVMYGVPSAPVWDPSGVASGEGWAVVEGYVVAPGDVALARPGPPPPPPTSGIVEGIWLAAAGGEVAHSVQRVLAQAGKGLEGDRHSTGQGTFPSGVPGSALTLIEAEVCESLSPPLVPNEHRRNIVTRGIRLNNLVGRDFMVGGVRCRGMRLCEPCKVVVGYAGRPVLRSLVHRGGLRADILEDGEIKVGDEVAVARS
jgi:hypothetical protein